VLAYLARYTHRVAITNQRLARIEGDEVTFTWKDYADDHRQRKMTLTGEEFLRRFLLHVLPDRFVRIRYYGLFANRHREQALARRGRLVCDGRPRVLRSSSAGGDDRDSSGGTQNS
jgi:Putative transposase